MPSDLVIDVRQVSSYPALSASNGTETLLLQQGGLGGPYVSIDTATFVSTALQQAFQSLGVGAGIPAPATSGQVFADELVTPLDGSHWWNAYVATDSQAHYWRAGPAAWFEYDPAGGFLWLTAPAGSPDALVQGATELMSLSPAGAMNLPSGTITVARDPAVYFEVATAGWVLNNTVGSFNARKGAVTLTSQDVYSALKLCDPIATQPWVQNAINASIQNLLWTCPFVNTWNGRKGSVYLMLSDITCVFYQSGQQPISPTPPTTSNDDSIATTKWVTDYSSTVTGGIVNVKNFGAKGDGINDDTAAIQAAINSTRPAGGSVYIPAGHYMITTTIYLPSNTHVYGDGDGSYLDGANWIKPSTAPDGGSAFFSNLNNQAATLTDSNISIENLRLDYNGSAGPAMFSGDKCITMTAVSNVLIENCSFYAGTATGATAQDAIAFMRCQKTWVINCRAFNFMNCPYDWWDAPKDAWLIDSYAETGLYGQTQMVCFNPENTAELANGNVADGFVMSGCTFVGLGTSAVPCQIEPLLDGNIARNIRITDNLFRNVGLFTRRNTSAATIKGNVFTNSVGGNSVISANLMTADRPDSIAIVGNAIINPDTTAAAVAAIFCNASNSVIADNVFSGGGALNGISVSTYGGVQTWGNIFPATSNGLIGIPKTQRANVSGIAPNSQTVTSNTPVMCGFGITATPTTSGTLLACFAGALSNTLLDGAHAVRLRYGTGLPPSPGGTPGGTLLGNQIYFNTLPAGAAVPFSTTCAVSGLTIGTTYWFDLQQNTGASGGTAQIFNLQWSVVEL